MGSSGLRVSLALGAALTLLAIACGRSDLDQPFLDAGTSGAAGSGGPVGGAADGAAGIGGGHAGSGGRGGSGGCTASTLPLIRMPARLRIKRWGVLMAASLKVIETGL